MRKITGLIIFCLFQISADAQELNGTTIGFGFGPNFLRKHPSDYSLSPDSNKLQIQELSRTNYVISTNVTVKFHDLSQKTNSEGNTRISREVNGVDRDAKWFEKFAITIGINLGEISSNNVSFNKQVDGGIGLAYVFTPIAQLAASFDIMRIRQMRSYIVDAFNKKRIPTSNGYLNALEFTDNNLFYNETFTGFSLKLIIALNPKKGGTPEPQRTRRNTPQ